MDFCTYYNRPPSAASPAGVTSMTDPQYARDCDITSVLERYNATGIMPHKAGTYADVSELGDFANILQRTRDGVAAFNALPSRVRADFGNDPAAYYAFVANPANRKVAIERGYLSLKRDADSEVIRLLDSINKSVTVPPRSASSSADGASGNT